MSASLAARPDALMPPPEPGRGRAYALALLVHGLLIAALTWGVNWRHESDTPAVEAELWSAVPRQAAPPAAAPAPAPTPAPERPAPAPTPPAPPPDLAAREAQIALEKRRAAEAKALQAAREKEAARARAEQAAREKALAEKRKAAEDAARRKQEAAQKAAEEAARKKQLEAQKAAQRAAEDAARAKAQREEAQRLEAQRQENIRRMQGLAGSSGSRASTGRDVQSAGPSGSYAGRVAARIRPNIVFTDDAPGNPSAEVEVRAAPDGTILSRKLVKSSGVKAWDEAVLKAIDKTERLPADTDGRVPSALIISFRPRD
ncbi:cell division and transport-associated protein TolA [Tibeticola sediminis]|uniref:Cell division and transport-associated protein TolA n=1 Tax=Tibeticola sediminis TaxID=1917811 RepID=A0A3N4U598_9BURK|nr:cell envelope integrity protein TolA [Tibeticola sediminis]RPE64948.1 cell division and transport-associated protein TolA [Tibeticola sediminis]